MNDKIINLKTKYLYALYSNEDLGLASGHDIIEWRSWDSMKYASIITTLNYILCLCDLLYRDKMYNQPMHIRIFIYNLIIVKSEYDDINWHITRPPLLKKNNHRIYREQKPKDYESSWWMLDPFLHTLSLSNIIQNYIYFSTIQPGYKDQPTHQDNLLWLPGAHYWQGDSIVKPALKTTSI